MTKTFYALGIAASLLLGTAMGASAAVGSDSQGNTDPTAGTSTAVQPMSPSYQGTTTTTPGYQTSQSNPMAPQVNRGNPEGAAGGAGGGSGSGGGAGGGAGGAGGGGR